MADPTNSSNKTDETKDISSKKVSNGISESQDTLCEPFKILDSDTQDDFDRMIKKIERDFEHNSELNKLKVDDIAKSLPPLLWLDAVIERMMKATSFFPIIEYWFKESDEKLRKHIRYRLRLTTHCEETVQIIVKKVNLILIEYILFSLRGTFFAQNTEYKTKIEEIEDVGELKEMFGKLHVDKFEPQPKLLLLMSKVFEAANHDKIDDIFTLFFNIWSTADDVRVKYKLDSEKLMHMFTCLLVLVKANGYKDPDLWFDMMKKFYNEKDFSLVNCIKMKERLIPYDACKKLESATRSPTLLTLEENKLKRTAFDFFDPQIRNKKRNKKRKKQTK